jgi:hypothetical protein
MVKKSSAEDSRKINRIECCGNSEIKIDYSAITGDRVLRTLGLRPVAHILKTI